MIEIRMYCEDDKVLDALGLFSDVTRHPGFVYTETDSSDSVSWISRLVTSLNSRNTAQIRLDVLDTNC